MMNFCDAHILAFLKNWQGSKQPLDLALSQYFRAHKSLGSHDRRNVGEAVYTLVRFKTLFEGLSTDPAKQLFLLRKNSWRNDLSVSEAARLGIPEFLLNELITAYGADEGRRLGKLLNTQAPTFVRANLLKTTRDALLERWTGKFDVHSAAAPAAIAFAKREPLFALPEFKEGLFEVQDVSSQRIAELVEAKSGDRILDFCSGSGGKTLAIAPNMQGKGELYLHDVRLQSLQEARKRLRRAGIQNAQVLEPGHITLKKLLGQMDWVLADVPCSGTGTLRRNPDMKWHIDAPMIERLVAEQRSIVQEALRYARPNGGRLVYATCSILPQENEAQVEYFIRTLPVRLERTLKLLPEEGGGDGFFAAVFTKIR